MRSASVTATGTCTLSLIWLCATCRPGVQVAHNQMDACWYLVYHLACHCATHPTACSGDVCTWRRNGGEACYHNGGIWRRHVRLPRGRGVAPYGAPCNMARTWRAEIPNAIRRHMAVDWFVEPQVATIWRRHITCREIRFVQPYTLNHFFAHAPPPGGTAVA